jgi:uncharacterized glyoxalase superfamily protein PhnB
MSDIPKNCKSTVIPTLRCKDAPAAIEWLCTAFGFEKNAVYPMPDGAIAPAQLTYGNGMIMLGSVTGGGGVDPQSIYLVVNDADAVYAQAKAAGQSSSRTSGASEPMTHGKRPKWGRFPTCRARI